jgi:hypothetical protein
MMSKGYATAPSILFDLTSLRKKNSKRKFSWTGSIKILFNLVNFSSQESLDRKVKANKR